MAESSLIPKKLPTAGRFLPEVGLGIFLRLAVVFFIISGAITGLIYLYKDRLTKEIADQKSVLEKLEVAFEPSTINELERVSNLIVSAKEVLRGHIKSSSVFDLLEANTISNVSFNKYSHTIEQKTVTLSGDATSYTAVSQQTRIFESLPEVASASFSNLALKENSSVSFALTLTLK